MPDSFAQAELIGVDVNLEISAFEYGIFAAVYPDGNLRVFYSNDNKNFDWTDFEPSLDIYKEFSWISNWHSFFRSNGTTEEDFDSMPLFNKLRDLSLHYGNNNIFCTPTNTFDLRAIVGDND